MRAAQSARPHPHSEAGIAPKARLPLYTGDSLRRRATRQAGIITARDGTVWMRVVAGQSRYAGNRRNGNDAGDRGGYDRSSVVER